MHAPCMLHACPTHACPMHAHAYMHHAYTQARDDDELTAMPEAQPACPRQPCQRLLWAVGTCTWCMAKQARSLKLWP